MAVSTIKRQAPLSLYRETTSVNEPTLMRATRNANDVVTLGMVDSAGDIYLLEINASSIKYMKRVNGTWATLWSK